MSNDLNNCSFIGRLGDDPSQKSMPNGNAVTNISIAVGEQWKDKQTGQKQESTEWVRIVAFGKLAEIMGQYLNKGSKIYVSGKMKTRKWQDQSGADRYSTEVIANQMQMLDSQPQGGQQQPAPQQAQQSPAQQQSYSAQGLNAIVNAQQQQYQQQQAPQQQQQQPAQDDFEGQRIPF